jgi:uncharacterized protein (DUF1015 family)
MAVLRPLRAVRPRAELAAEVASVPYDVVDTAEARSLAAGNPLSFLHVVRSEIDLPVGTDPHSDVVYTQAAAAYHRLQAEGTMLRDPEPALYLYRQTMGSHTQTAVVGCCSLDEYDAGAIRKHEKTRPDKEEDRTRHILALGGQAEPVFLTYRGNSEIDRQVAAVVEREPALYDFVAPDGVRHSVWRVEDGAPLAAASFATVPVLYIADGHHRSASASRARERLRDEARRPPGTAPHDLLLAALFPAEQLRILPYNRVVHDLAGQSAETFLARLGETLELAPGGSPAPAAPGSFAMHLDGRWWRLSAPRRLLETPDPVASLDAAILQAEVLGPLLGIDDPRTSERIEFVGGSRGTAELERRVAAHPGSIAFSLYPVGVEQLLAVADAGRVLPPKSTWFEPKLRSGLLVHDFGLAQESAGETVRHGSQRSSEGSSR